MKIKKKIFTLILLTVLGPSGFFFLRGFPSKMITSKIPLLYYAACTMQGFALEHNTLFFPERYKTEIEDFMLTKVPEAQENIDKIMFEMNEYYENFVNDNTTEKFFFDKMDDFERALDSEEYSIYSDLSDITDKYLLLQIGELPSNWADVISDYLSPYFERSEVNTADLKKLNEYLEQKKQILKEYRLQAEQMINIKAHYYDDDKLRNKLLNKAILRRTKYKGKRMPVAYC